MKVSLHWAQKYTDIDLSAGSAEELVKVATERLGGVEGYVDRAGKYEHIYIAKIVSIERHPDADKLNICKIDDAGSAKNVDRDSDGYVQVVCGAPVVKAGWLVGWLAPGSVVPASLEEGEPFTLSSKELRGVTSHGMLGTPAELAISRDNDGLLVIPESEMTESGAAIGSPLAQMLGLEDLILDIENKMFTHRPDCFGILGVARELAGIQHKQFTSPDWYLQKPEFTSASRLEVKIYNHAPELAPRVMAVVLDGAKVSASPLWMQSLLNRVGIKAVNNIVDITNYMMYLTGQPMHAFDYDKIAERSNGVATIGPRMAAEGEKLTLLGGKQVTLTVDDLVLATDRQPVDIAGVMGGAETEVDEGTQRILLTCCAFDMYEVRRMTMRHGVFTDAATRNTKGQPAAQIDRVMARAMYFMTDLASTVQASDVYDDYQSPVEPAEIEIDKKFINDRLGSKFTDEEIVTMLQNVEFEAHVASGPISVTPPFWRTDIEIKEDIVEEIGRMYGFNLLPLELPKRSILPARLNPLLEMKANLRETLARAGANEVQTYSFVHGDLLKKVGQNYEHSYAIRNALSPDLQYYRLSILPSVLDKVSANIKSGYDAFALFEIGKVHYKGEMDADEPEVPNEDSHIALVVAYSNKQQPEGAAYYHARKYLGTIAPELVSSLVPLTDFDLSSDEWGEQLVAPYEPARSALIIKDEQIWGVVGEFRASVTRSLKLPTFAAGFEVNLGALSKQEVAYRPLSRFPSVEQDVTLKVPVETQYQAVLDSVQTSLKKTDYIHSVEPLGVYKKEGNNTKNISFRLRVAHFERTLKTDEVSDLTEKISEDAASLGAERV